MLDANELIPPVTVSHPARLRWALALNYAGMMCLAIAVNLMPVYLTTVSTNFGGLTNEQLGRIGAMTFVGVVAGVGLSGPLADRWGAKLFALLGNLLIAVGLAGLSLAPSYPAVLLAVTVMGVGAGILDMVLSPIVAALQPDRRTTAMNWLHSFYCIGAVATILIAMLAIKAGVGWRLLAVYLIPLPLLVAAGFIGLPLPPLVQEGHTRTPLRILLRLPVFLAVLLAIFLAGATELGMAQWLPAYAEYTLHFAKWVGGAAFLAFSLAMAVGRMVAGMLGHRFTTRQILTLCCWGSVGLFLLACFAPWRGVALAACMLAGLTGSCLWPSTLGIAGDRFPQGGASMFGLLSASGNFGGIFMPWVAGAIADLSSLRWGLATATLCPLLMLVAMHWMRQHEEHGAVALDG